MDDIEKMFAKALKSQSIRLVFFFSFDFSLNCSDFYQLKLCGRALAKVLWADDEHFLNNSFVLF